VGRTHAPPSYALGKCLYASKRTEVYAAIRTHDSRAVVLKAYVGSAADADVNAQREFTALRQVAGPGIPVAVELLREDTRPIVVLEQAAGIVLEDWVATALPPPDAFLEVAIQLADALARVHEKRLIHCDVTPQNVVVDPGNLSTCLLDFSLARRLGSGIELRAIDAEGQTPAGTLSYIAPEQTGRMDRGVDSRSDLYGLGGTLYHALTGRSPFDSDDPLTLIHAHMARLPIPPLELRPELPATLSRIVVKLLQKAPEARYQTARALHHDLCECREQLRRRAHIDAHFALGSADAPYRPLFSKKLYGREREVERLLDSYRDAAQGRTRAVWLTGPPGVGKSALAHELRVPLAGGDGYVAHGKFDLYRREIPYLGFVQAFESLTQQILTESDARLAEWRKQLGSALGPSAGVLIQWIPDLAIVLGDVPPVPKLGPGETRARLGLAVERFIQALALREHPLVLFLDDLQWADPGSRDLLQELLTSVRDCALLVLGSYRDTEVDAAHPLSRLIRELEQRGVASIELELAPLSNDACTGMLAEALGRTIEETRPLAACVARKTASTPLLIQQFVSHMYDLGLICFRLPEGWSWDDGALAAAEIPEDAVGLMTAKIARLAPGIAEVVQLASCVGDSFDLDTLRELSDRPRDALESALFALCDEGLIAPSHHGFRFGHDRIREAAQTLLSGAERSRVHLKAARLLLERMPADTLAERSLEIADHFNGVESALPEEDRWRALEANDRAGRRALGAGAAATARRYFASARALCREGDWETERTTLFQLHLSYADTARQEEDFALAVELLEVLELRAATPLERAWAASQRIVIETVRRGHDAALPLALQTFRRFGRSWPASPSRLRTCLEVWRTDRCLRGPLADELFRLVRREDVEHTLPLLILILAAGPAIAESSGVRLICITAGFALRLMHRHGYVQGPGMALASYAAYRMALTGDARDLERCAKAALDWSARAPSPLYSHRVEHIVHTFVYGWTRPRLDMREPLLRVAEQAREAGDTEYEPRALAQRAFHGACAGIPLPALAEELEALVAETARQRSIHEAYVPLVLRAIALVSRSPRRTAADVREVAQLCAEADASYHARMFALVFVLGVACVLRQNAAAHVLAERTERWVHESGGSPMSTRADFAFFRGIAAAGLAADATRVDRRRLRRVLARCHRDLATWARCGPDFVHMAQALEAERQRLHRQTERALRSYAQAAERAARQGYRHHAALMHERRAELLLDQRRETEARGALERASGLYEEWGALAKAEALRARSRSL
jgi:hypothetical protein